MGSGDAPPSSAKASSKTTPQAPPPPPPPATSTSQDNPAPVSWTQGFYPPTPGAGQPYFMWPGQPMVYGPPYHPMYAGGYPYGLGGMASPPGNDAAAEGKSSKSKKRKTKSEAAADKASVPRADDTESEGSPSGNSEEDKPDNKKSNEQTTAEAGPNGYQYSGVDFWNSAAASQGKQRPSGALVPSATIESDLMLQDERELKRQRRKQSNRESARRSRQRKQKECEELSHKVEDLSAENEKLKAHLAEVQEIKRQLEEERDSYLEQLQALQQQQGSSPSKKAKQKSSSPTVQNNQQHLPEVG